VARGPKNFATLVDNELPDTVAANYFLVLRVEPERVLPAYLAWYLNCQPARAYFQTHQRGTSVAIVTKAVLGEMELPVPPIEIQRKIVRVNELLRAECRLVEERQALRASVVETALLNLIW
jgi:restriction endonuclease S subunit